MRFVTHGLGGPPELGSYLSHGLVSVVLFEQIDFVVGPGDIQAGPQSHAVCFLPDRGQRPVDLLGDLTGFTEREKLPEQLYFLLRPCTRYGFFDFIFVPCLILVQLSLYKGLFTKSLLIFSL